MHTENVTKVLIATRGSDGMMVSWVACFVTKTAIKIEVLHELCGISCIYGSEVLWSVWVKIVYKDKILRETCSASCKRWFFYYYFNLEGVISCFHLFSRHSDL